MIDDVSPLPTEQIVFHARCEMRAALLDWLIAEHLAEPIGTAKDVKLKLDAIKAKQDKIDKANKHLPPGKWIKLDKVLTDSEKRLKKYTDIAVSYDLDFNITEHNHYDGSFGLKLPFTVSPAALDLGGSGYLHARRQGQRVFKANDRWARLATNEKCDQLPDRSPNPVYPISGKLGADRLIRAFIDLSEQGIPKDTFVETLTFTTEFNGTLTAGLKLNAEPKAFRLINAGLSLDGGRIDVHKMVISLAFPVSVSANPFRSVDRSDGDLEAPFQRSAEWRARYNLCVADARSREDSHNSLRLEAPEVYCIKYADAFAPEGARSVSDRQAIVVQVVTGNGGGNSTTRKSEKGFQPPDGSRNAPGREREGSQPPGRTTIQKFPQSQEKRPNFY